MEMGHFNLLATLLCLAFTVCSTFSHDSTCVHYDEQLYCYSHNPNTFHRCVKGRLFTFKCPPNLKFNMDSSICDWDDKCLPSKYNYKKKGYKKNYPKPEYYPKPKPEIQKWKKSHKYYPKAPSFVKSLLPSCKPDSCLLPHCHCPSTYIPKGFKLNDTPQMVMVTFDDELTGQNYNIFKRLFHEGRNNPNGCPIKAGFFITGQGTEYQYVYPLYQSGNEINVHTVTHRYPKEWWSKASYYDYSKEVKGLIGKFQSLGIPKDAIKGFRVPFLQVGGDSHYQVLRDNGFLYDSSMFTEDSWRKDKTPIWPYTLDKSPNAFLCHIGTCPKKSYPGMWQIPLQRWYGVDGKICSMADECNAGYGKKTLQYFRDNFSRYYYSNRAPFGIHIHLRWLRSSNNFKALDEFMDELLAKDDVWIVTPSQVIKWIQKPLPTNQLRSFKSWPCYKT